MEPDQTRQPTVSPDEAKRSVVDAVDRTASLVDGDWEVLSGPRLGLCPGSDGSGPVSSIDFLASSAGGSSIDGESQCADGDHGDLATGSPTP